jgi:hypothetical protein
MGRGEIKRDATAMRRTAPPAPLVCRVEAAVVTAAANASKGGRKMSGGGSETGEGGAKDFEAETNC